MLKKYWLSLESKDGGAKYVILDDPGELEGFIFTLQCMNNDLEFEKSVTNTPNKLQDVMENQ